MKRTLLLALLLSALLTVAVQAYEVDLNYSGLTDSFTGLPLDESTENAAAEIVMLDEDAYYDRNDGMFVYRVSGTEDEIRCSVADGMTTNAAVRVEIRNHMTYTVYLDGQELEEPDLSDLSESGSYALTVVSSAQSSRTIRFTVLSQSNSSIGKFWAPEHFRVTEVLFDDEPASFSGDSVDLSQEGVYRITAYCVPTGIPYVLDVQIDHTAPSVTLNGVVDGVAKGPVTISDVEPGASIYIELNGRAISVEQELTQSGSYVLTVADEAGNVTTYNFVILVYLNTSGLLFFAVFLLIGAVLLWYLIRSRRRLRVR